MAQGIQDIANGLGLIYITDPGGITILGTQKNNVEGARQVRQMGATAAPISATRPAVGSVRYTAVGGVGNVNIVLNAVAQCGAAVAASVGAPSQTAADVAAAINSFIPGSGPNYTAQAVGDTVYIFSPPEDGVAVNGTVVTATTTNVAIVTVTLPMSNGADGSGALDTTVGLRFFLNADYTSPVDPLSLAGAIEITSHMIVRGTQSGTPIVDGFITSDVISTINRYANTTEIKVTTQGSAPTDYLGYINPYEFAPGDAIRLRASDTAQVTTVVDVSDPVVLATLQRNIYLCNQASFDLSNNRCITLVLVYDSTLGLIWVEDTRAFSSSSGMTTILRADLVTLLAGGGAAPDQSFFVIDVGDAGFITRSINTTTLVARGDYIALVKDWQNTTGSFGGVWHPNMSAPIINRFYMFGSGLYRSLTGAIGTEPQTDVVNWVLATPSTNPTQFLQEIHTAEVDMSDGFIFYRVDRRNNEALQTKTFNAFPNVVGGNSICWGNDKFARNKSVDNDVIFSDFMGAQCFDNFIGMNSTNGSRAIGSYDNPVTESSFIINSTFGTTSITSCFFDFIVDSDLRGISISGIGTYATSAICGVISVKGLGLISTISITATGNTSAYLSNLTLSGYGTISLAGGGGISLGGLFVGAISINFNVVGSSSFNATVYAQPAAINITLNSSNITNCIFLPARLYQISLQASTLSNFTFDRSFYNVAPLVSKSYNSQVYDTLDITDPAIFSGGTLIIPLGLKGFGGTYRLTGGSLNINKIQYMGYEAALPSFGVDKKIIWRFYPDDSSTLTMTYTAVGIAGGNDIIGDVAADVIVGRGTIPASDSDLSDYIELIGIQANANDMCRKLYVNSVI